MVLISLSSLRVIVQLNQEAYVCCLHFVKSHQNRKVFSYLDFLVHKTSLAWQVKKSIARQFTSIFLVCDTYGIKSIKAGEHVSRGQGKRFMY